MTPFRAPMRSPRRASRTLAGAGAAAAALAACLAIGSAAQADPGEVVAELADNARFSAKTRLDWHYDDYPEGAARDDADFEATVRLGATSDAFVGARGLLRVDLVAWASTIEDSLQGVFAEPGIEEYQVRYLDARVLSYAHETDWGELVAGKDLISLGATDLYSPTDVYGGAAAFHPLEAEEDGVWQAGAHYFLGNDTLSYRLTPFHERQAGPGGRNRWVGAGGSDLFFALPPEVATATLSERYRDGSPGNWSHLATFDAARAGYDYFVLAHRGVSPFPALRQADDGAEIFFPKAASLGGGVSAVTGAWKLTGEAIAHRVESDEDDDVLRYAGGFSYRETRWANAIGLQEIKPTVEYAGEWLVDDVDLSGAIIAGSRGARAGRNTLSLRLDLIVDDEWRSGLSAAHNFTDEDVSLGAGVRYAPDDNTTLSLGWARFSGDDDTQFGRWSNNDLLSASVDYRF